MSVFNRRVIKSTVINRHQTSNSLHTRSDGLVPLINCIIG